MKEITERNAKQLKILDTTLRQILDEAHRQEKDAKIQGWLHRSFMAVLAVLAVVAPALVTYQTQNTEIVGLPFIAIGVTAIAGAGAALQSTFRWSDRFRRAKLTSLELNELHYTTDREREDIEDTDDPVKVYSKICELNRSAAASLRTILRNHIQAEMALMAPRPEGKTEKNKGAPTHFANA